MNRTVQGALAAVLAGGILGLTLYGRASTKQVQTPAELYGQAMAATELGTQADSHEEKVKYVIQAGGFLLAACDEIDHGQFAPPEVKVGLTMACPLVRVKLKGVSTRSPEERAAVNEMRRLADNLETK